jgi:hypothetical protein
MFDYWRVSLNSWDMLGSLHSAVTRVLHRLRWILFNFGGCPLFSLDVSWLSSILK